jgi:hypothetical protein
MNNLHGSLRHALSFSPYLQCIHVCVYVYWSRLPGAIHFRTGIVSLRPRVTQFWAGIVSLQPGAIQFRAGIVTLQPGVTQFRARIVSLQPGACNSEPELVNRIAWILYVVSCCEKCISKP